MNGSPLINFRLTFGLWYLSLRSFSWCLFQVSLKIQAWTSHCWIDIIVWCRIWHFSYRLCLFMSCDQIMVVTDGLLDLGLHLCTDSLHQGELAAYGTPHVLWQRQDYESTNFRSCLPPAEHTHTHIQSRPSETRPNHITMQTYSGIRLGSCLTLLSSKNKSDRHSGIVLPQWC